MNKKQGGGLHGGDRVVDKIWNIIVRIRESGFLREICSLIGQIQKVEIKGVTLRRELYTWTRQ